MFIYSSLSNYSVPRHFCSLGQQKGGDARKLVPQVTRTRDVAERVWTGSRRVDYSRCAGVTNREDWLAMKEIGTLLRHESRPDPHWPRNVGPTGELAHKADSAVRGTYDKPRGWLLTGHQFRPRRIAMRVPGTSGCGQKIAKEYVLATGIATDVLHTTCHAHAHSRWVSKTSVASVAHSCQRRLPLSW